MTNSSLKAMLQGAASVFDLAGSTARPQPLDYKALSALYAARENDFWAMLDVPTAPREAMMKKNNAAAALRRPGAAAIAAIATQPLPPLPQLPSPAVLQEYEQVLPGSAERLMLLMEKQVRHRMELEQQMQAHRIDMEQQMQVHRIKMDEISTMPQRELARRGQWLAAVLATLFGMMAGWLGYHDHDWLAGSIALTTISTLAAIFALGKRTDHKAKEKPASGPLTP